MEKYISNYTGEQIDTLLSQIQSNVSQADLDALKAELVLRLQGTSTNQDGYKDPVFYKEFVGSATLEDMNTWLDNQFFAIKDGVYYRNGQSGSYAISKDVPQCLINLSYQGIKIYVFNSPRSYATGTFAQFAIGAAVSGNGITWGSHIMRRQSTYDFTTKKATWTAWEKINSDVDKSYVDTQLTTKVDKVAGKGLSTNDYTTAEKNLVATIPNKADKTYVDTQLATKTSKEYVDNKVKEANANANNAAKIRTEDMQYMGVAFDSEEGTTLRFRASEDPTSKNIGDTITLADYGGMGADVSVMLKITEGQTIVVENSGMPAAVLLGLGGNDAKIVAKTQTDEVLCVYTCPLGDEFIYIYGTSAKYRIYNSDLWRYLLSGKVADVVNECNNKADKSYVDEQLKTKADKTYVDKALSQVALLIPESLSVEAPKRLTWGNKVTNYIKAVLAPSNVVQNIIYISDNKAVEVGTDGSINVIAKGISRVHVIPTNKTALAKTIQIEVGDPRLRLSAKTQLRFTANGSLRLT